MADRAPREIRLADGRALVLRTPLPGDVDALAALYASLPDEDVYLRFFSAHRPDRELFEHIVSVDSEGGGALVAEVREGDDAGAVVADAWYSMLPDGDGELAITVAPAWRGGLGTDLLDALLDLAADRGVRNLQAEILLRNRAMMTLVRRRGCVTLADDGPSVRVAVGSAGRLPTWAPGAGHPRILVEGRRNWHAAAAAERAGATVLVCPGAPGRGCPVDGGEDCPLVAHADAVVVSIPSNDERTRSLVRHHRSRHGDVPVFSEGADGVSSAGADGAPVAWSATMTDDELVQRMLHEVAAAHPPPDAEQVDGEPVRPRGTA